MGTDEVVFVAVVAARLGIPLLIFRFPLPAIIAALVLDAADQSIFQLYTDLDLDGYQSYDKSLDVYYLAIAYLSTMRNWTEPFAADVAAFLWYYRLVGVVVFELTQSRAVLLIFPNTFEYFFICYEAVRLAWDPARLGHRQVIGLAAFLWIFVKLPQEWWLHVAQLDVTDFMREDVFGVSLDTSWSDAIADNLWFVGLMAVVAVIIVFVVRAVLRRTPPTDWPVSFDVDDHPVGRPPASTAPTSLWTVDLIEKVFLTSMITIIFSQVIPGSEVTALQVTWSVALLVIANAAASMWLSQRGHSWQSTVSQFVAMLAVNAGIAVTYLWLLRRSDRDVNERALLFFLLLLTLIITLFDRYRPIRAARLASNDRPEPT